MTLSEIRRAIDALKRRFATELAIIKTRRIAEVVSNDWDPDQPPEPHDVIQRFVKAGCRLPTFANLSRYLNKIPDARATCPNPATWSSTCSPGLTAAATAISSTGTYRLSPPAPRYCRFRRMIKRPYRPSAPRRSFSTTTVVPAKTADGPAVCPIWSRHVNCLNTRFVPVGSGC